MDKKKLAKLALVTLIAVLASALPSYGSPASACCNSCYHVWGVLCPSQDQPDCDLKYDQCIDGCHSYYGGYCGGID